MSEAERGGDSAHLGWWDRRKARRLAKRRLRPCGAWSPGLVGVSCDLPYQHDGKHGALMSRTLSYDLRTGSWVTTGTTRKTWGPEPSGRSAHPQEGTP